MQYSVNEMAEIRRVAKSTINRRLKKTGAKYIYKDKNIPYYSQLDFDLIKKEYDIDIIVYTPVYITQTFYIYESKMNRL